MGRYVFDLLREAAGRRDLEWQFYGEDPRSPMTLPAGLNGTSDVFEFRGDRFQLWEQLGLPLRVRRNRPDVLHCTEGSLPWWQPIPTVVTLHDTLAWAEQSGTREQRAYWERVQPAALARCAAVITISESSRRDIAAKWPALADKLVVIPHGIAEEYLAERDDAQPGSLQQSLHGLPYLLYLGGPVRRKRFDWAVEVLRACDQPDLQLVAVGFGSAHREAAAAKVPPELRSRVHFAAFQTDDALRALYRGAVAALYPTLYEGFGFPAIEAQAAGTPVVFSAVSSLAELVGPLARVVEPHDLDAWCQQIRDVQALGDERRHLAAAARQWARRFSWKASFEAHMAVYRRAAGHA